uniref:non-specific serine/threonine protein kinase n=1 Tax=Oryza rufipogon TaxID=4529 RepID=A0A0E0PNX5_ORYRU
MAADLQTFGALLKYPKVEGPIRKNASAPASACSSPHRRGDPLDADERRLARGGSRSAEFGAEALILAEGEQASRRVMQGSILVKTESDSPGNAEICAKRSVLMERYVIGRQLGQGTFGKVYYARNLSSGQSVAIKMIDKEKILKVGLMEQIKREISIMRLVRHPNVLQLFEVMATKSKIYFALEYAKGGELFHKMARAKLNEESARNYFQQLISAMDYCHSRGVYHRDLKPENLLLDENETLKVSDFGLSALAESRRQDGLLHTACGTPAYVAPEVLSRKGYSGSKADVWSCGVILFVLVANYLPFHDRNIIQMYRKIAKAEYRCPRHFSAELKELLYGILDPDPSTRMSISRIKRSAWYRKPIAISALNNETGKKSCTSEAPFSGPTICISSERNQEPPNLHNLNAFDIISLSTGFDLSGLFGERYGRRESLFTSRKPAAAVLVKLKELAKALNLKVTKTDNGVLKLATTKEGRKGRLELDAEVSEVAPSFLLVELKKTNGDTLEYQRMMKEDIRPSLKDIIWTWQGNSIELPNDELTVQCSEGEVQKQSRLPSIKNFLDRVTVTYSTSRTSWSWTHGHGNCSKNASKNGIKGEAYNADCVSRRSIEVCAKLLEPDDQMTKLIDRLDRRRCKLIDRFRPKERLEMTD